MVRTYSNVNATTSRIGELFDLVFKENQKGPGEVQSRPVSDISLGPAYSGTRARPNSVPSQPRVGWTGVETVVPREESILVEAARRNPSYYDYERQMRDQDRQQRQAYMADLQRQLEEQREQRIKNEIALGGHEFETELMKQQQREGGRSIDRNGFAYNSGTQYGTDYDKYLRAAELQQKREYAVALQQQQYGSDYRSRQQAGTGYTPTFAPSALPQGHMRRERSVPTDLNLFHESTSTNYDPLVLNYTRDSERRQSRIRKQQSEEPDQIYDPWGKGGAGAPIRDRNGRLITDRRHLQKSWHSILDSNLPHDVSQNRAALAAIHQYNTPSDPFLQEMPKSSMIVDRSIIDNPLQYQSAPRAMSEKDYYKEELRKQIEEQKRLRQLEKEKERLEEERDRLRIEREAERQRREIEEESRKQQIKAERALRRAEQTQNRSGSLEITKPKRPPPDDGLEWWERQPQTRLTSRSNSANDIARKPPTPKPPTPTFPFDQPAHPRRSTPPGTRSPINRRLSASNTIDPDPVMVADRGNQARDRDRSALARNEQIMRQLSAMRERLNKEQMRVRSAIRRREYGDDLFEDDGDRAPRYSPPQRPLGASHKSIGYEEDDDPPLVKLIKNSRTLDSASLRRPPPTFPNAYDRIQSPDSTNHDAVINNFMNQRPVGRNQNGI